MYGKADAKELTDDRSLGCAGFRCGAVRENRWNINGYGSGLPFCNGGDASEVLPVCVGSLRRFAALRFDISPTGP